jgi:hypothetical protein
MALPPTVHAAQAQDHYRGVRFAGRCCRFRRGQRCANGSCAKARIARFDVLRRGPREGPIRRGGRVAEGARLESVFTGNRNVGSNPTPSATFSGSRFSVATIRHGIRRIKAALERDLCTSSPRHLSEAFSDRPFSLELCTPNEDYGFSEVVFSTYSRVFAQAEFESLSLERATSPERTCSGKGYYPSSQSRREHATHGQRAPEARHASHRNRTSTTRHPAHRPLNRIAAVR